MQPTTSIARILIIDKGADDQPIDQSSLRDFELVVVNSVESGRARLEQEPFDLLLLDEQLPGIAGDPLLATLRSALNPRLPVVVMAAQGNENGAADWMKNGRACDYLARSELGTPRVAVTVRGAIEKHRLEEARCAAERELLEQKSQLQAALQQLEEAHTHLVQSEKMATLGQLVAGVAHEINNPLAYVSNNIAVLDRDVRILASLVSDYHGLPSETIPESIRQAEERVDLDYTLTSLDHLLSSTKQGVQRVRTIVVGLRDFSRVDEADRRLFNPNDAVRTTLEMVQYHIRHKGIQLVVELGELPMIWCFAGKLNQVLLNIIMNAIQAVDSGATITVRSWANHESREIALAVSDDGPGIPESIRSKIFEPFYTTKPQGLGTGLGLWISDNIVHEHQGRIELETAPDQGTTFTVILPTRPPAAPA